MKELYDELKEKNSVARSARSAVSGKKKYLLPSDRLSQSEIKKLNGEITVYEMKKPISWAKFKSYPRDVQKEYLQWFADEFSASRAMVCEMMGIGVNGFYFYAKDTELLGILHRMPTVEGRVRFQEWLAQYREKDGTVEEKVEAPKEEPKKEKLVVPPFFNTISSGEILLEGKASEIGQTLFNMFQNESVTMKITFEVIREKAKDGNSQTT